MQPLYCIPGLGTDLRIFGPLSRHLPLIPLSWIAPAHSREALADYCRRLAGQLPSGKPVTLLGLSFGAVAALEVARQRPVERVIVLSGIKTPAEKPLWLQLFRYLPLYQLSRGKWRIHTLPLWATRYGITDPAEIALLQAMFSQFDDSYRMWAIRTLAHWEGQAPPGLPVGHIHGTQDQVFPISRIQNPMPIEGGNHFMVYQKAEQVARLIREQSFLLRGE